jgi:serine protease Do
LLNLRGEVVGMNSMIRTSASNDFAGIGFSIPARILRAIGEQLAEKGRVVRGWLGISLRAEKAGIRVNHVQTDSPAAKGGLQANDLITAVNGRVIMSDSEFRWVVGSALAGSSMRIALLRNDAPLELDVVLGEMPPQYAGQESPKKPEASPLALLGLRGQSLPPGLAGIHGFTENDRGVFVIRVEPESAARTAGILPGELLAAVDGKPVTSPEECDVLLAEAAARGKTEAVFTVQSEGVRREVTISIGQLLRPPEPPEK